MCFFRFLFCYIIDKKYNNMYASTLLIVSVLVISIGRLLNIVNSYSKCTATGEVSPCITIRAPGAPCRSWNCLLFSITGIVVSLALLVLRKSTRFANTPQETQGVVLGGLVGVAFIVSIVTAISTYRKPGSVSAARASNNTATKSETDYEDGGAVLGIVVACLFALLLMSCIVSGNIGSCIAFILLM
jgi:hypothetical protein